MEGQAEGGPDPGQVRIVTLEIGCQDPGADLEAGQRQRREVRHRRRQHPHLRERAHPDGQLHAAGEQEREQQGCVVVVGHDESKVDDVIDVDDGTAKVGADVDEDGDDRLGAKINDVIVIVGYGAKASCFINLGNQINGVIDFNGAEISYVFHGAKVNDVINGAKVNDVINGTKINDGINGAEINDVISPN